jgi:hypothetical protein
MVDMLLSPAITAMVYKATSDDRDATPGYLFVELSSQ